LYNAETKSLLAKLMATENIRVEHRSNAKTAQFDLEKRVLVCPIWKNMSGDLYDLIMGHEISHALRTPAKGWRNAVECAGGTTKVSEKVQKAYHGFLNTIEDARIEKHVKRQYPGLRAPMIRGYKDLLARDFFGLRNVLDYNSLYLINKLNLVAKCGSQLGITFTPEQQPFYDAMLQVETWEDTVALTNKLFEFSKDEQKQGEEKKQKQKDEITKKKQEERKRKQEEREQDESEDDGDDADSDDEGEESDEESDEVGQDKTAEELDEEESEGEESGDGSDESEDSSEAGKESDEDSDDDGIEEETAVEGNDLASASDEPAEDFLPKASTDETFREKQKTLVDDGTIKSVYVTIPTPNLKDVVVPSKKVMDGLNLHYNNDHDRAKGVMILQQFKERNEAYVGLLAQEFERKKAAKNYTKSKVSTSGDINVNKLASYRLDDNMFKKLTIAYKGKSHGLVLLLDRSSSMRHAIEGATEQLMVLAMFCRKVNIPFAAYSFTTPGYATTEHDFGYRSSRNPLVPFSTAEGEMVMGKLAFREILNSSMQGAEFNNAMMKQLQLSKAMHTNSYSYSRKNNGSDPLTSTLPEHEGMQTTPLNEAIIVLRDVVRNFRKKHNLDLVNTIIMHDGDADWNYAVHTDGVVVAPNKSDAKIMMPDNARFDHTTDRVTVLDRKEKLSFDCPQNAHGMTIALLNWLQATTGCGVFGFFVIGDDMDNALGKMYTNKDGVELGEVSRYNIATERAIMVEGLKLKLNTERFLESYNKGFTRFYFLPSAGDSLRIQDRTMQLEGRAKKWNAERLEDAFRKVSRKQFVSRVLVSRFMDLIAAH